MLRGPGIVVRLDEESLDACLDILPNVAGLREGVAVGYCEGDVELLAQCPAEALALIVRQSSHGLRPTDSRIYVLPTPVGPISSRLLLSIFTW